MQERKKHSYQHPRSLQGDITGYHFIPHKQKKKKKLTLNTRRGSRTLLKNTCKEEKKHISHSENDGSSCRRDLWVMLDNNAGGGEKTNSLTQGGGGGGGGGGDGGRGVCLGCESADHMVSPALPPPLLRGVFP